MRSIPLDDDVSKDIARPQVHAEKTLRDREVKDLRVGHFLQPTSTGEMAQEEYLKLLGGVKRFELSGIATERESTQLSIVRAPASIHEFA